jgi:hypothetical protein
VRNFRDRRSTWNGDAAPPETDVASSVRSFCTHPELKAGVRAGLTFREVGAEVVKGSSDAVHEFGVSGPALLDVGCWNQNTEGYTPLRTRSGLSLSGLCSVE